MASNLQIIFKCNLIMLRNRGIKVQNIQPKIIQS